MMMLRNRFAIGGSRRDSVLHWRSTGKANLEMIIERSVRGERFVRVGTLGRTVHVGSGRFPIARKLGRHHIRPGTYTVRLKSQAKPVRCVPKRLLFTIVRPPAMSHPQIDSTHP